MDLFQAYSVLVFSPYWTPPEEEATSIMGNTFAWLMYVADEFVHAMHRTRSSYLPILSEKTATNYTVCKTKVALLVI